jgi:hypothetical protein
LDGATGLVSAFGDEPEPAGTLPVGLAAGADVVEELDVGVELAEAAFTALGRGLKGSCA